MATVGTIPLPGDLSMDDLAAEITRREQLGFTQLTDLTASTAKVQNLGTFIAQPNQLKAIAIYSAGSVVKGTKISSPTVYISGTKTDVDVYRLP